jgi:hypothetical protein
MRSAGRPMLWTAGFFVFVFLTNVYRAATQSMTVDESLTYLLWVKDAPAALFGGYLANHHVLHSILMWLATLALGTSDLALRAPALLGGALYLAGVWSILRRLEPPRLALAAGAAALALNPYVLDFLVAARGYGLALGCATLAADRVLAAFARARAGASAFRAPIASGLLAGAAVACHLGYAVFTGALVLAVSAAACAARPAGASAWRAAAAAGGRITLGALLVAAPILWKPLAHSQGREDIIIGKDTLDEATAALRSAVLHHAGGRLAGLATPLTDLLGHRFAPLALCIAAVTVLVTLAAAGRMGMTRTLPGPAGALTYLAGGLLAATSAAHALLHSGLRLAGTGIVLDLPWPPPRVLLDLVTWWTLGLLGCATWLGRGRGAGTRLLAIPALLVLSALALVYAAHFNVRRFHDWDFDADTKAAYLVLEEGLGRQAGPPIRVGATWRLIPTLSSYRERRAGRWMHPIPNEEMPSAPCDVYVLAPWDAARVEVGAHLRIDRRFPLYGTVIATPK